MKNTIQQFLREEDGVAAIEYGLLAGLIAVAIIVTVTTLGTPLDVTLQELRIECFFPADERTAEAARLLAGP